MKRRQFTGQAAALAATLAAPWAAGPARAQAFPSRPISLLVAFAPGGPADVVSRIVAQEASNLLGQPVIVENRAGANGKIAMQALMRAPRDGHTLAYISPSIMSLAPLVDKDIGFDPLKDIVPLTTSVRGANVIAVHPSVPARNLRELVAYAKANPRKLNYGSIGVGSWYHLAIEKVLVGAGVEMTHVPYKGESAGLTDLVAGTIQVMIVSGAGKSFLDEGKIVGVASTGNRPASHFPRALPVRESGVPGLADYDETVWIGFGMAAGAPPDVVAKVHTALVRALQTPEVKQRVGAIGEVQTCTPDELREVIRRELATNRQLIESGRVKLT